MKVQRFAYILPLLFIFFSSNQLFAARTELISKSIFGGSADGKSEKPSMSSNARYIAFQSTAKSLVADKTTNYSDIFLYDRITGAITRLNVRDIDVEADGHSANAKISADGTVVVFMSAATNLLPGDTEGFHDIFAYDSTDGTVSRISVSSDGVAGDGDSDNPDVSDDGRYIVFQSHATNLVDDDTNDQIDIFRHDRQTNRTIRVNYDFLDEEATGHDSSEPVISDNGRYVAFQTVAALTPCDDNGSRDIFIRDITAGLTSLASVTHYGCVANSSSYHPSISGDGRFVAFSSNASNLILAPYEDTNHQQDVYIRDLQNEITERISVKGSSDEGDGRSVGYGGNISSDGQYVVFSSDSTNFVQDDTNESFDVFVRDRTTMQTTRESVGHYWEEGSGDYPANTAVISANGRYVVFDSRSSELVSGDSNNNWDIFIRDYLWPGPLVYDISPHSGDFHGGTVLTISGSNFQAGAAVTIDGVPALNVVINSATTITCITPPHTVGSVEVQVTNPDGNSWLFPVGHGFTGYIYRPMAFTWMGILL